jgi:hypothetical protein
LRGEASLGGDGRFLLSLAGLYRAIAATHVENLGYYLSP